jgi:hypothetical protein
MTFDEARRRLIDLLIRVGWPQEIVWVDESQIVSFPERVFVFLRGGQYEQERVARGKYDSAAAKCPAVRLGAVGIARGRTLAAVWPIEELGQGEEMFLEEGVKIDIPAAEPRLTITRSIAMARRSGIPTKRRGRTSEGCWMSLKRLITIRGR